MKKGKKFIYEHYPFEENPNFGKIQSWFGTREPKYIRVKKRHYLVVKNGYVCLGKEVKQS